MDKDQELRLECLRLSVSQGGGYNVKYANEYFEFVRDGKVPTPKTSEEK